MTEMAGRFHRTRQKRIFQPRYIDTEDTLFQMNENEWKRMIVDSLRKMADYQYQKRSWTGCGPEISSIEETISGVFDDALFVEYVKEHKNDLPAEVVCISRLLDDAITDLDLEKFKNMPPYEMVEHPDWANVRTLAAKLLRLLSPPGAT